MCCLGAHVETGTRITMEETRAALTGRGLKCRLDDIRPGSLFVERGIRKREGVMQLKNEAESRSPIQRGHNWRLLFGCTCPSKSCGHVSVEYSQKYTF